MAALLGLLSDHARDHGFRTHSVRSKPREAKLLKTWRTRRDSNPWPLPSELELQCYASFVDPTLECYNSLFIQCFIDNKGSPSYPNDPHSFRSGGEFLVSFWICSSEVRYAKTDENGRRQV